MLRIITICAVPMTSAIFIHRSQIRLTRPGPLGKGWPSGGMPLPLSTLPGLGPGFKTSMALDPNAADVFDLTNQTPSKIRLPA